MNFWKLLHSTKWSYLMSLMFGAMILVAQFLFGIEQQAPIGLVVIILFPIAIKASSEKSISSIYENMSKFGMIAIFIFSLATGPYSPLRLYLSAIIMKFFMFTLFFSIARSLVHKIKKRPPAMPLT